MLTDKQYIEKVNLLKIHNTLEDNKVYMHDFITISTSWDGKKDIKCNGYVMLINRMNYTYYFYNDSIGRTSVEMYQNNKLKRTWYNNWANYIMSILVKKIHNIQNFNDFDTRIEGNVIHV